jgi:hypothetical protein
MLCSGVARSRTQPVMVAKVASLVMHRRAHRASNRAAPLSGSGASCPGGGPTNAGLTTRPAPLRSNPHNPSAVNAGAGVTAWLLSSLTVNQRNLSRQSNCRGHQNSAAPDNRIAHPGPLSRDLVRICRQLINLSGLCSTRVVRRSWFVRWRSGVAKGHFLVRPPGPFPGADLLSSERRAEGRSGIARRATAWRREASLTVLSTVRSCGRVGGHAARSTSTLSAPAASYRPRQRGP